MPSASELRCNCGHLILKDGKARCSICKEEVSVIMPVHVVLNIMGAMGVSLEQLAQYHGLQVIAPDWIEELLAKERECHRNFFGRDFDLTVMRETLEQYGEEQIKKWQTMGLEVHFLPRFVFQQSMNLPAWEIRPENWFWEMKKQGKILVPDPDGKLVPDIEATLGGIVVLIDTRLKPKYQDGKQMWVNDRQYLAPVIKRLRNQKKIQQYKPATSRFNVSAEEMEIIQQDAGLANLLGIETKQIRLETTMEMNLIPQIYKHMARSEDGGTNTSVWCHEYFEGVSYRLRGGEAGHGGLAHVYCYRGDYHWYSRSFRFLGVLAVA